MKLISKNKAKILKLFYAHPEEQFYIQQIGRLLGKKPGVFQRALNNLEQEGILQSEYKANARFFKINKGYPVYQELKSIIFKTVKLALLFIFIWAGSILFAQEQKLPPEEMTLGRAIILAFKNNLDIQMQEREVEAASANIVDARSNFLPKINLNASYTRNDKVLAENIFAGYPNDNQLGLSLNESLYNGGADIANYRQARIGLDVQRQTLRAKKLDVEFEAKRLYYGLLLAYESERIAKETLDQAQKHYDDVKHKFSQGTASRFDVLQSGVQVSLLAPNVVRAANEVKLIKAELNKLLARPVDTFIETREGLNYAPIEIKEPDFLQTAYLNKPEMNLKILGVDINKWGIQMAKSGYRPQLDISADYTYRSNNTGHLISGKQKNWNAGIYLTLPIFEGFSTKAKVDEAKARYAEAILDKQNLYDQIAVDIRQDCLNLREAEAVIISQKDHVAEAREALTIAEVSYDNGVGINLDVLDAQVSLAQIQNNLASGIYDYLMAEASLNRNMGMSFIQEEKNAKDEKKK
jgi:outer membrane protein TolC